MVASVGLTCGLPLSRIPGYFSARVTQKPLIVKDRLGRTVTWTGSAIRRLFYQPVIRDPFLEVLPTLQELGIGLVPYSPLGKGFLTGKVNENTTFDSSDFRNIVPRFTPEARKANQALVDLLGKIAERKKATPAQIALAWLLAQKPWIVPIPGTRKLERLDENLGAVSVELTSDDLRDIDSAASKIKVEGDRYPERLERMTGL